MQIITKLLCPHCHAILKSSKPLHLGKQVQCLQCKAPFSVSAADLARSSDDHSSAELGDFHASGILVSAALAEDGGNLATDPESAARLDHTSPDLNQTISSQTPPPAPRKPPPLMATPYMPPPIVKEVPVALPFAPPPSRPQSGLMVAVLTGFVLFIAGGMVLVWYCLSENPGTDQFAVHDKSPVQIDAPVPDLKQLENPPPAVTIKKEPAQTNPDPKPDSTKNDNDNPVKPPPMPLVPVSLFTLPGAEQKQVNQAIKQGVKFLKSQQHENGSWLAGGLHAVGFAALPGLTLLECQVPAADPAVQKAAVFVRRHAADLIDTYDLSLAILFLDRLGKPGDRALIQQMALRLVAGQTGNGGWDYKCTVLSVPEMTELMIFLRQTRPKAAQLLDPLHGGNKNLNPFAKPGGDLLADPLLQLGPGQFPDPILKKQPNALPNPLQKPKGALDDPGKKGQKLIQAVNDPANKKSKAKVLPKGQMFANNPPPGFPLEFLPPHVGRKPDPPKNAKKKGKEKGKGWGDALRQGRDDNSNTQFAMLALWAARRHGIPTENTLARADKRYHSSQNPDGGWGYMLGTGSSPAMTGVGLLGLAIGHGASEKGMQAALEAMVKQNAPPQKMAQDPAIQNGLHAFSQYVGSPDPGNPNVPMVDLYFLWTVERVAMLYNLKTVGDKDWYRWGVHVLVPNQKGNGSWSSRDFPGHSFTPNMATIDSCFALLFLKRSNLVQDLTENLNFYLAITDPAAGKRPKNR